VQIPPAGATGESLPPEADARPVIIDLPTPPSVNALYRNVPGHGRVKTERYRTWAAAAGWEIARQRPGKVRGRYAIRLTVERTDNRRRDLANLIKAAEDLLVTHDVIEDDSLCQEIHMAWSRSVTGCRVEITPIIGG
jgi:Holliday junction resolvase RusA-like endonuclease